MFCTLKGNYINIEDTWDYWSEFAFQYICLNKNQTTKQTKKTSGQPPSISLLDSVVFVWIESPRRENGRHGFVNVYTRIYLRIARGKKKKE